MATNCPGKNDGVAGHPGAPPPPPAQPTPAPDPNSLPSTSQQSSPSFFLPPPCNYPSQPDEWSNIPALDNDDAINASVFSYIEQPDEWSNNQMNAIVFSYIDYFNASLPPPSDATAVAPFLQPAMPPPSQQQHRYPSQPDEELSIPVPGNNDAMNANLFGDSYFNASTTPPSSATLVEPFLQPAMPPPSQQQHHYPPQPDEELRIPALGNNDAMNASLFGDSYFNASSPPPSSATPVAPFVQPAMPPPPQMQLAMQPPRYSQQPTAMITMGETQYYYSAAAPEHAVLPDAPPPPAAEPAKQAGGRRRGRPRGSTAKSKSKSKVANTAAAAGRRQQEAATASAIIARKETVGAGSAEVEEDEQKVVKYADTNIPGVRFKPTDAEIIWYLERKYHGHPLPVNFIKEFDVLEDHPETIQVGFWKSSGKEDDVLDKNNVKIGKVNTLTFKLGRQPKGTSTPWRMTEYRMEKYQEAPNPSSKLLDLWVLCKLFRAKDPPAGQHDVPVQAGDQLDEGDEHAGEANGGGGEDTIDGNQPQNGPEDEPGIENYYFSLDDFTHGDPKDH